MMSTDLIVDNSISSAWLRALMATANRPTRNLDPLLVSLHVTEKPGQPVEDAGVRAAVDAALTSYGCYSVAITASLIFPYRAWERAVRPDRKEFFSWYIERFLPRLKARARANQYGTYFERMISFSGVKGPGESAKPTICNQLNHIIRDWQRKRRRPRRPRQSALQAACFDPVKDHTGQALRGFPCLQQVGFCYDNTGGLGVNAYYPTEYIFDRGYGNYLGLCHLGIFMAHELGLRLARVNCYIGQPLLGRIKRTSARALGARLGQLFELAAPSGLNLRASRGAR